jgi:hypothetical protein
MIGDAQGTTKLEPNFGHFSLYVDHLTRPRHYSADLPSLYPSSEHSHGLVLPNSLGHYLIPDVVASPSLLNHDHAMVEVFLEDLVLLCFQGVVSLFHS